MVLIKFPFQNLKKVPFIHFRITLSIDEWYFEILKHIPNNGLENATNLVRVECSVL